MTTKKTTDKHRELYQELCVVLLRYDLPADEILAIVSNLVGKVVAMQDQRRFTKTEVMDIVIHNLEIGNKQMVDQLTDTKGNA